MRMPSPGSSLVVLALALLVGLSQARPNVGEVEEEAEAVIPSPPNQFAEDQAASTASLVAAAAPAKAPVYASPFARARAPSFESQESSHAPSNYVALARPVPSVALAQPSAPATAAADRDLKAAASYGHHHHGGHHSYGGHGYGPSGWLDMGAWTGGKGAFGWYADYPVGGKHHGYHGRR